MRFGPLRHRVEIQSSMSIDDGMGGQITTWTTDETYWASVSPLQGAELYQAQQTQAKVTHKIVMRYAPDITPKNRMLFGSKIFDIEFVRNVQEKNKMLELLVVERQA